MVGIQRIGGGVVGASATAGLRASVDEAGASPYTQPSVLFGVGSGLAAGAAYFLDIDLPVVNDSFLAGHAVSSIPLGLVFATLPKRPGTSTTDQVIERISGFRRSVSGGRRNAGSNGSSGDGSNGGSNGGSSGDGSNGGASTESFGSVRVNGTRARRGAGTY